MAFYLLTVVRQQLEQREWFANRTKPSMADYLDLVALGTVADVVPLDQNNRVLVNEGLRRMRAGKTRPGILHCCDLPVPDLIALPRRTSAFSSGQDLTPRVG